MFAVGLSDVGKLVVRGIAFHVISEEPCIVIQIPIVKGKSHILHIPPSPSSPDAHHPLD